MLVPETQSVVVAYIDVPYYLTYKVPPINASNIGSDALARARAHKVSAPSLFATSGYEPSSAE